MAYILKDTMSAGLSWLSWVFSAGLLRPLTGTFTHLRSKRHALIVIGSKTAPRKKAVLLEPFPIV